MSGFVQEYLNRVRDVVASVDLNLLVIVLAVGVVYYLSAKLKVAKSRAGSEVNALREEIEALSREIAELRARLSAVTASGVEVSPSVETKAPVPAAAPRVIPAAQPRAVSEPEPRVELSPMARGMAKSRGSFLAKLKTLFTGGRSINLQSLDDLEELLISSDVGARVSGSLVEAVREHVGKRDGVTELELRELLKEGIRRELIVVPNSHRLYQPTGSPLVVLVVGVNGVGKTTTVAKLATRYRAQGKRVLCIAADTFRAAAVQQLKEWGARGEFEVFSGPENAKPAAVVFDGIVAAKEKEFDVVLIDTAGRLHTKSNLMQELEGVKNSIRRHIPEAPHETLLVVDGVSGQNALSQAREFNASTPLTGLVVTKLDGTPKGGIIVAISQELKVPVLYVGVGEKAQDLIEFSVPDFIEELLPNTTDDGRAGAGGCDNAAASNASMA
jgi:fused signal recognition particle receptor